MVKSECCLNFCTSRNEKNVSYFKFPSKRNRHILFEKWLAAVKNFLPSLDENYITRDAKICSKHFLDTEMFKDLNTNRRTLNSTAVPSIFKCNVTGEIISQIGVSDDEKTFSTNENNFMEVDDDDYELCEPVLSIVYEKSDDENRDDIDCCPANELNDSEEKLFSNTPSKAPKKEEVSKKENELDRLKKKYEHLVSKHNSMMSKKKQEIQNLKRKFARLNKKYTALSVPDHNYKIEPNTKIPVLLTELLRLFKTNGGNKKRTYSEYIKLFSMTLDFHSSEAYNYIQSALHNILPHKRTIQKWRSGVNYESGFSEDALNTLKFKAEKGQKLIGSLVVDEMSIRKMLAYNNNTEVFEGKVNYGNVRDDTNINSKRVIAKEVIVFLLNLVNSDWKIPIGYYFVNGIKACEKANLITQCLQMLHKCGVTIISLTFNGLYSNISTCKILGASLKKLLNLKPWFPHPDTKENVYLFFDAAHAIKLVRNNFAASRIFYNDSNCAIEWKYFEELEKIQNKKGMYLGTKICKRHINWRSEEMNVKLATQTLSRRTSLAFKYLRTESMDYKNIFFNSGATEEFMINFNDIFDIFNSHSKFAEGYKKALQKSNEEEIFSRLIYIKKYISAIKGPDKKLVIFTKKRAGFVDLLMNIESLIHIYSDFALSSKILGCICTYKFSQNHLKTFFCAVQLRGGHNNDPSTIEFKTAFKHLVKRTSIKEINENCQDLCDVPISVIFQKSKVEPKAILSPKVTAGEVDRVFRKISANIDYGFYAIDQDQIKLSPYIHDVISNTAGAVVRIVKQKINCQFCKSSLEGGEPGPFQKIRYYEQEKDLISVSVDVKILIQEAERQFMIMRGEFLKSTKHRVRDKLILQTLKNLSKPIFIYLEDQHFGSLIDGLHTYNLMKLIIGSYIDLKLYYETQWQNNKSIKCQIRQITKRSVILEGQ